jgi:mannose-6-phosphate isomerase-like protein (cupin superfamily)
MSIPQFLEKNYIGRDPLKESVVGCTAAATTRILQLRDSLAAHNHDDLDETLYVVAGEGVIRVKDEMMTISPGSLTVIPRGQPHSTERRGRNPLILLSTLSGAPCPTAANSP